MAQVLHEDIPNQWLVSSSRTELGGCPPAPVRHQARRPAASTLLRPRRHGRAPAGSRRWPDAGKASAGASRGGRPVPSPLAASPTLRSRRRRVSQLARGGGLTRTMLRALDGWMDWGRRDAVSVGMDGLGIILDCSRGGAGSAEGRG
uniref:Uncharacterized protein n=1 Tax=Oryza meridionalis TaxID=40149 RepID=A0A0E0EK44_9ORYZ